MRDDTDLGAEIKRRMILFSGMQEIGFMTNPDINNGGVQQHIEIKGQTLICLAQGGECRDNRNYYSGSLNDSRSWTTPIIDESCPNRCPYKMIVCDNHEGKCEGSYHPHNNKFAGKYDWYCRNFSKFGIEDRDRAKGGKKRARIDRESPFYQYNK